MSAPKTPANSRSTRVAVSPATPFTPFSARYAWSSPAYSTPASSLNPSPVVYKPKSSVADTAHNWRDRSPTVKRLPLVQEEDVLLPAANFNHVHIHNDPFTTSDSSASDEDLGLVASMGDIRVSLPKAAAVRPQPAPRSLFDALDMPAAPTTPAHQVSIARSLRPSLAQPPSLAQTQTNPACFVCGFTAQVSQRGQLNVLDPCSHLICRSCLTQNLNIVGEKTFACACGVAIRNFCLVASSRDAPPPAPSTIPASHAAPPGLSLASLLLNNATGPSVHTVLRLSNVCWDVAPPMLAAWCAPHPIVAAHIMLDRKGKTLSHAFIECATPEAARAVMRDCRTKILGTGRRARGVTVTLSSQEELSKDLFTSWQGRFDDAGLPTLDGVPLSTAHSLLARGMLSTSELDALLDLIQHPDSVFLKSPSLPYYVLTSLLSRAVSAFILPGVRERLFCLTISALDMLLAHIADRTYDDEVLPALLVAGRKCRAFTDSQKYDMGRVTRYFASLASSSPSPPLFSKSR